jgi:hypothetical protein
MLGRENLEYIFVSSYQNLTGNLAEQNIEWVQGVESGGFFIRNQKKFPNLKLSEGVDYSLWSSLAPDTLLLQAHYLVVTTQ